MLAELLAHLLRCHVVDAGEHRVEAAELADELGGGLFTDAGHTRDVVGRIALERLVIDHLVGPEAEPLLDPGDVVHHRVLDAGAGRHQPNARCHELEHVEVDGHDRRLEIVARIELGSNGPDDVVRLVALHLIDGDTKRLDDLADLGELVAQIVRHPLASRLVLGVLVVPERLSGQVERHGQVVGLEILEAAQDDAGEPEDAVDEVAPGRRQGRKCVVAAIDEPVPVEQHEAFSGHGPSVAGDRRTFGGGVMSSSVLDGTPHELTDDEQRNPRPEQHQRSREEEVATGSRLLCRKARVQRRGDTFRIRRRVSGVVVVPPNCRRCRAGCTLGAFVCAEAAGRGLAWHRTSSLRRGGRRVNRAEPRRSSGRTVARDADRRGFRPRTRIG